MKVLFVDDEPRLLEAIERSFFDIDDSWEVHCVTSGSLALQRLSAEHFDVIVSDMRMPEMDGETLLQEVHQRHPAVIRIILTGQTDGTIATRSLRVAHQFLSKPCDPNLLVDLVRRTSELNRLLEDTRIRGALGRLEVLPSAPRIYQELTQLLEDPDVGVDEVAELVTRDPAMTAKLLQLASSSFFSRGRPTTDIKGAVLRLGANTIKNLVLTAELFRIDERCARRSGLDVSALQRQSFDVGCLASKIVTKREDSERAFVAGILHDVGHLATAQCAPDHMQKAIAIAGRMGRPLVEVEEELYGLTHAEVGGYLLGIWGLPYVMVEAVANHHKPRRATRREFGPAAAVHIAEALIEGTEPDLEFLAEVGVAENLDQYRNLCERLLGGRLTS